MTRMVKYVGLVALGLLLTGCVSAEKYNALKLERDNLAEQMAAASAEAKAARAQADAWKAQLDAIARSGDNKDALIANQAKQLAEAQNAYDDLRRKYDEALTRPGQGPLPKDLTGALEELARQFPDVMSFDPLTGLVKFKSDVTFASGSADLTAKAKEVIGRFAKILNSQAASGYEFIVAGHTDNTRVINQETINKGHKDNWYLSAHRAISVGEELMKDNINPQRLGVLGYGDQRPAASNSTDAGKAQNRRVEVLILPTTVKSGAPAKAAPAKTAAPTMKKEINKDTVVVPPTTPVPPDLSK